MKASIIKIGNSKGVRIPKLVLEQCGFENDVCLEVVNNQLVISAEKKPREGWNELCKKNAHLLDDEPLLMPDMVNEFDRSEWEW